MNRWMDAEADRLQHKVDRLEYDYQVVNRRAARQAGADLIECRELMAGITGRIMTLRSRIQSLRQRRKI